MLTKVPGCRAVCQGAPSEVINQLVAAFKDLRDQGVSEVQSLRMARDPSQIVRLCSETSVGGVHSVAEALVASGCAECTVNLAYSD